jgi:hypothetical protein
VLPLCSAINRNHPETPISQSNNIVDISGVGLKQFWNLKGHMQDASTLATAHYPETLDRIFIIGAPSFFPTVWGWVKRWFDPITVSKIFILSPTNVFPTLSQYIDPENIPIKYGGKMDYKWGDMPNLEPEIEAAFRWESPATQSGKNTFPIGPMKWEKGENGEMQAFAMGSEKGVPRRKLVFTIPNPVGKQDPALPVVNTPIDEAELRWTTVGTATHPTDAEASDLDNTPPSEFPTLSGAPQLEPEPAATSTAASGVGLGKETTLPMREGTSGTRYEQQGFTHASGQLADGTPHAAVNDHGHGDKTVTMEPNTVGQAPKDVPIPIAEPPAPGYVDQAKAVAAQASSVITSTAASAAGAVTELVSGDSAKAEEKIETIPEKSAEQKALDAKIDQKKDPAVEGFLREQTTSAVQK